ncbi:16S rRNA (adenine(1518)-N(6)/adenine(1519)-N(6))-dimethyltransferase RsmA [Mycoplasmatota bacterium]|nr:16S rRNA (adenine(1518)-N(6)/adenine(1519)-N(6))-dimethyltransferase RsmA [Mycoplasmatota bacterium]
MAHQAKKRFGQNFLTDKNLLEKIVRLSKIKSLHVIEIGPGQGALTSFLARDAKDVIAYEIDYSLKKYLDPLENKFDNLNIVYEDFMKIELDIKEVSHIVANVPYYITTPIIFKFLETENIQTATMMIQKEVADRLNATPNQKAYNSLSVLIQYYTKIEKLMQVNRHMFHPAPNVDSIVIRMEKRTDRLLDENEEKKFIDFVKRSFTQKRKTLVNNLSTYPNVIKQDIINYLNDLGYDERIRAEQLTIDDFIKLSKGWTL